MRRFLMVFVLMLVAALSLSAGSPHFVGVPTSTVDAENSLLESGKVAGLGNVPQIHVELSADAACINNGGHHPKAVNKGSFSVGGDFPVQNGKALFLLALDAVFQPPCDPPMTVTWSNISLTVTAADGTFLQFP
jgi:hypothetical protein